MAAPKKATRKAAPKRVAAPKPVAPIYGRNRTAVNVTVTALQDSGRLAPADAARVSMVESLADAVDADPGNASLWREFRQALDGLMVERDDGIDEFAAVLGVLQSAMVDPEVSR